MTRKITVLPRGGFDRILAGRKRAGRSWRPGIPAAPLRRCLLVPATFIWLLSNPGATTVQAFPTPLGHTAERAYAGTTRPPLPDPATGSRVITVSRHAQKFAGIETVPLAGATRRRMLRAYGTVLAPEQLAHSCDHYVKDRAALATARAKLQYAKEEYRRQQTLYAKGDDTSQKDLQAAKATGVRPKPLRRPQKRPCTNGRRGSASSGGPCWRAGSTRPLPCSSG